jgi:hypothetical protein
MSKTNYQELKFQPGYHDATGFRHQHSLRFEVGRASTYHSNNKGKRFAALTKPYFSSCSILILNVVITLREETWLGSTPTIEPPFLE